MLWRRSALFLLVVSSLTAASPQNGDTEPNAAQPAASARYTELIKKLEGGDTTIDFQALRYAFADRPDYVADGHRDERKEMYAALSAKQYEAAINTAAKILAAEYVNIDAHLVCVMAYDAAGDPEKAKFHAAVARALFRSILNSGDGKSEKTAMTVISIAEEHDVMNAQGLRAKSQALLNVDGHAYDRWDASDPATGKEFKLYFNIDKFFGRY